MSKSSGGLGLIPLLIFGYFFLFDDDEKEKNVEVKQVIIEVKEKTSEIKDEVQKIIDDAKKEFAVGDTDAEIVEKTGEEISQETYEPPEEKTEKKPEGGRKL